VSSNRVGLGLDRVEVAVDNAPAEGQQVDIDGDRQRSLRSSADCETSIAAVIARARSRASVVVPSRPSASLISAEAKPTGSRRAEG